MLSVERYTSCWKSGCRHDPSSIKCLLNYLDCDTFDYDKRNAWANSTNVFSNCNPNNNITFDYGIFKNAVGKNVISSNFAVKYFYCLWWGLQQLRYLHCFYQEHTYTYFQWWCIYFKLPRKYHQETLQLNHVLLLLIIPEIEGVFSKP